MVYDECSQCIRNHVLAWYRCTERTEARLPVTLFWLLVHTELAAVQYPECVHCQAVQRRATFRQSHSMRASLRVGRRAVLRHVLVRYRGQGLLCLLGYKS